MGILFVIQNDEKKVLDEIEKENSESEKVSPSGTDI